ncbi:MAG: DUF2332 domain-containing protein [Chloroflexota bacterium]
MTNDRDVADMAARFRDVPAHISSPLYQALARTVTETPALLRLAARGRPGQVPTFLLFGAVHALLLAGADHEMARYFPSVAGTAALPPDDAGPALVDFCARYQRQLAATIETRLVQTNVVKRALALWLGMAAIRRMEARPVHLIEVGASAGVLLRFDRYGYVLGGRSFGDLGSPVQIAAEWHAEWPVPNVEAIPDLASVSGVDLNPLDAGSADDRTWLEALVWPENHHEAALLHDALAIVAADPPPIWAGDAVEVCPTLARELPPGEPRVVFHAVTRLHVPPDRLAAFDAAIASLGDNAPLYWLSFEGRGELDLRDPSGEVTHLAQVEGHLEWVRPLGARPSWPLSR